MTAPRTLELHPPQRWCIVTCEYPPRVGGVSDHTFLLAGALAASGDAVDVWAPPGIRPPPQVAGVTVHVLPSMFRSDALMVLRRMLRTLPSDTRVLVQYVPTGYGWRMMNLPFALLLYSQRWRGLDVYFHEVGFPIREQTRWRRKFAGAVHLAMNWLTVRSAARVFVAIPEWEPRLRALAGTSRLATTPATWVPVPSNVPDVADPELVRDIRAHMLENGARVVVGHFGTFGRFHSAILVPTFARILDDAPDRVALLVGRNSGSMRRAIVARRPDLDARIVATKGLVPADVSAHLSACDVLVQPYDDGVSARRGSLMAGLALGLPIVTNRGPVTGDVWTTRPAVYLTESEQPEALAAGVTTLLSDAGLRAALGVAAHQLHRDVFSLELGVARLRNAVHRSPAAEIARTVTAPRVLMFHTTLPLPGRKPGGVEVAVHRLANALVALGVPVTVASLTDAPSDARYVHRRLFAGLPWLRDSRFGRLVLLPFLLNAMSLGDADVVHYHGDDWFIVRRPRASVRTLHGSALREAERATRLRRRLGQYAVYPLERLAGRLSTIAVAVGGDAARLHGITRVIGNGVDPTLFAPGAKSATPTILYVGTWEGRKRGRWMYELFVDRIAPHHPTVELHFIADVQPPHHARVRYERFPDDAALATAYRESWVFALPSTYEGFGIPYLEAMSSGTAVLATPNTGARELLGDGQFGMLATDAEYDDALLRLLGDDTERQRVADAGLARSRAFGWPDVARAYLAVYGDAIRMRHGVAHGAR
ncbi:MAG: glycosyltransferase family 4 protein [bacterium]